MRPLIYALYRALVPFPRTQTDSHVSKLNPVTGCPFQQTQPPRDPGNQRAPRSGDNPIQYAGRHSCFVQRVEEVSECVTNGSTLESDKL